MTGTKTDWFPRVIFYRSGHRSTGGYERIWEDMPKKEKLCDGRNRLATALFLPLLPLTRPQRGGDQSPVLGTPNRCTCSSLEKSGSKDGLLDEIFQYRHVTVLPVTTTVKILRLGLLLTPMDIKRS